MPYGLSTAMRRDEIDLGGDGPATAAVPVQSDASGSSVGVDARDRGGKAFTTVETHRDVVPVSRLWRTLLNDGLATPYQSPGFLEAWIDHVAGPEGVEPLVVVARDADGAPVALLPFGVSRRWGLKIARFLGGRHANFNMPVIRRDRLADFRPEEVRRLLRLTAEIAGVDAYALSNQPFSWDGVANPFAALPRQPSPDPGFSGPLAATPEDYLKTFMSAKARSTLRRNLRRFEDSGRTRFYRARTAAEVERILDAYFAQKSERLNAQGIANVFDKPGVRDFIRAATRMGEAPPAIDLYAFEVGDRILATFGTISDGRQMSGMFNSITSCELSRYSPGISLLSFMVEDAIERGHTTFDLGVGTAPYKAVHCPDTLPLFDSMVGVTVLGRSAAAAFVAMTAAKAWAKANPHVYGMIKKVRKLTARGGRADPGADDAD